MLQNRTSSCKGALNNHDLITQNNLKETQLINQWHSHAQTSQQVQQVANQSDVTNRAVDINKNSPVTYQITKEYLCGCDPLKRFKNFQSLRLHFYQKHQKIPPQCQSHDMNGLPIAQRDQEGSSTQQK